MAPQLLIQGIRHQLCPDCSVVQTHDLNIDSDFSTEDSEVFWTWLSSKACTSYSVCWIPQAFKTVHQNNMEDWWVHGSSNDSFVPKIQKPGLRSSVLTISETVQKLANVKYFIMINKAKMCCLQQDSHCPQLLTPSSNCQWNQGRTRPLLIAVTDSETQFSSLEMYLHLTWRPDFDWLDSNVTFSWLWHHYSSWVCVTGWNGLVDSEQRERYSVGCTLTHIRLSSDAILLIPLLWIVAKDQCKVRRQFGSFYLMNWLEQS